MKRAIHSAFLATWKAKALAALVVVLEIIPSGGEELSGWLPDGTPLWACRWAGLGIAVMRIAYKVRSPK